MIKNKIVYFFFSFSLSLLLDFLIVFWLSSDNIKQIVNLHLRFFFSFFLFIYIKKWTSLSFFFILTISFNIRDIIFIIFIYKDFTCGYLFHFHIQTHTFFFPLFIFCLFPLFAIRKFSSIKTRPIFLF